MLQDKEKCPECTKIEAEAKKWYCVSLSLYAYVKANSLDEARMRVVDALNDGADHHLFEIKDMFDDDSCRIDDDCNKIDDEEEEE